MRKASDDQLSLDLLAPSTDIREAVREPPKEPPPEGDVCPEAAVFSFTEKKAERDRSELNRYYTEILKLVRHFN